MNRLGFALAILAVVAAAAWAYHINYRTKTALGNVEALRGQIAAKREGVEVLKVEWAYLNAPDRLAALVELNNDRLGLEPMAPRHFDEVAAIPFPPRLPKPDADDGSGERAPEIAPEQIATTTAPLVLPAVTVPMPPPRPASWSGR